MVQTVRFRLDPDAVAALRAVRARLPRHLAAADEPGVTVAAAAVVPPAARDALRAEMRMLAWPSIWLATLGTVAGRPDELVLHELVVLAEQQRKLVGVQPCLAVRGHNVEVLQTRLVVKQLGLLELIAVHHSVAVEVRCHELALHRRCLRKGAHMHTHAHSPPSPACSMDCSCATPWRFSPSSAHALHAHTHERMRAHTHM